MEKGSKHTEETKARISKAMKGSNNAEKWFGPLVVEILENMIEMLQEDVEIWSKGKRGSKINSTGEESSEVDEYTKRRVHLKSVLLVEFKIWNADWFSDMKDKFQESKTISRLLKVVDMICEVNTYNDAANGTVNSNIAKMHLSTHYGWADNSKVTTKVNKEQTDEEIQQDIDDYEKRNK